MLVRPDGSTTERVQLSPERVECPVAVSWEPGAIGLMIEVMATLPVAEGVVALREGLAGVGAPEPL